MKTRCFLVLVHLSSEPFESSAGFMTHATGKLNPQACVLYTSCSCVNDNVKVLALVTQGGLKLLICSDIDALTSPEAASPVVTRHPVVKLVACQTKVNSS